MPPSSQRGREYKKRDKLSATDWNRMVEAVAPYKFEPPLFARTTLSGTVVGVDETPFIWARIVSGGADGSYGMQQVIPIAGGGWTDYPFAFTATEINGFTAIGVGIRVKCEFDEGSGEWFFQGSSC